MEKATGSARITFPERVITSQPKHGEVIQVDVPTHVAGVLEFRNGAIATIVTSFDVWAAELPCIEIYGSEGSLSVPDPNGFGGPVRGYRPGMEAWTEVPLTHGFREESRGVGVAGMAQALRSGRAHRASGVLAYHVLDIMHAIHDASKTGKHIKLTSTCKKPQPLRKGLAFGKVD